MANSLNSTGLTIGNGTIKEIVDRGGRGYLLLTENGSYSGKVILTSTNDRRTSYTLPSISVGASNTVWISTGVSGNRNSYSTQVYLPSSGEYAYTIQENPSGTVEGETFYVSMSLNIFTSSRASGGSNIATVDSVEIWEFLGTMQVHNLQLSIFA